MSSSNDLKAEYCQTVASTICGQRQEDYGDAKKNFSDIAKIWSVILDKDVTEEQVCSCMIGVKLARLMKTPGHYDTLIDIGGYAGVAYAIRNGE